MVSAFKTVSYPYRLYCGPEVFESDLLSEVTRLGGERAFVLCSPSIVAKTSTVERIEAALGERHAGTFSGLAKDSTFASVQAATEAAGAAHADSLIAVGGGSVIVAVRAVAIFLAEGDDPMNLMTQYRPGEPP